MTSKRKSQHDGLAREEFDEIKIRKAKIEAPGNSNITINLPSASGTLLTATESDSRFVQTANVNQTVDGIKTCNRIDITGELRFQTAPLRYFRDTGVLSTVRAPTGNAFQSTFTLPTYTSDSTDNLVAATATQTLTNKTLGVLRVATSGSGITNLRVGSFVTGSPGSNNPIFTVSHGLITTPTQVFAMVNKAGFAPSNDAFIVTVSDWSTTQINFQVTRTDVNSGWGNSYTVHWMALIAS
jgi:hypothetical protein